MWTRLRVGAFGIDTALGWNSRQNYAVIDDVTNNLLVVRLEQHLPVRVGGSAPAVPLVLPRFAPSGPAKQLPHRVKDY
jgi:hypothetical protein